MATKIILNRTAIADAMVRSGIDNNSQLSRLTGIDRAHLGRILAGTRPAQPSQVIELAETLRMRPAEIICPDDATVAALLADAS